MSRIYTSADQLIGHTPLLELTHIEKDAAKSLTRKLMKPIETLAGNLEQASVIQKKTKDQ